MPELEIPAMVEHSPGPWRVHEDDPKLIVCFYEGNLKHPMLVAKSHNWGEPEVSDANARLIAAAPDMLAALKLAEMILSTVSLRTEMHAKAIAAVHDAIQKATK
jgi:hypothetical protein